MSGFTSLLRRPVPGMAALLVSAVFLIGALALMIEGRASILRDGAEFILKSEPVDPRDLLRGDYVRLQYEGISIVDGALFEGRWPEKGSVAPVWLTLAKGDDGLAIVKAASFERPERLDDGTVALRSKPARLPNRPNPDEASPPVYLQFGIERYYVPEGEGLEIEKARNEGRTTVAVRISKDGEAQIARLMIDGEALYEEPVY